MNVKVKNCADNAECLSADGFELNTEQFGEQIYPCFDATDLAHASLSLIGFLKDMISEGGFGMAL